MLRRRQSCSPGGALVPGPSRWPQQELRARCRTGTWGASRATRSTRPESGPLTPSRVAIQSRNARRYVGHTKASLRPSGSQQFDTSTHRFVRPQISPTKPQRVRLQPWTRPRRAAVLAASLPRNGVPGDWSGRVSVVVGCDGPGLDRVKPPAQGGCRSLTLTVSRARNTFSSDDLRQSCGRRATSGSRAVDNDEWHSCQMNCPRLRPRRSLPKEGRPWRTP